MVLGYSVHPGNENDGKTFPSVYEKINHLDIEVVLGDTAYKTPAIAHKLKEDGIALLSTYSRPKTKDGFSANTNMFTMNTMTVISVRRIKF